MKRHLISVAAIRCGCFFSILIFPVDLQAVPPMQVGISNSIVAMTGQTPKDSKEAHSRGDNLVAAQHASGEFENVTNDSIIRIRHKTSGVICQSPGLLIISPPTEIETLSASRKFTCVNFVNGFQNDLSITKNSYALGGDRAIAALVAEMRAETNALNYVVPRVSWDEDTVRDPNSSGVISARLANGNYPNSQYFYISVVILNNWIISDTVRGPFDQRGQVDTAGEEMMRRAIRDVQMNH